MKMVLDTEGKEFSPYNVAYAIINEDNKVVYTYDRLIRDGMFCLSKHQEKKVRKIQESKYDTREIFYKSLIANIKKAIVEYSIDELYIYHPPHDLRVLGDAFNSAISEITVCDIIDTARSKFPGLKNYKMETVLKNMVPDYRQKHTAIEDVLDSLEILRA